MLDAINHDFELQVFEGGMVADLLEGVGDVGGQVSVGKHSMTLFGDVWCRFCLMLVRESGFLARRATARLPWEGCERMRLCWCPGRVLEIVRRKACMVKHRYGEFGEELGEGKVAYSVGTSTNDYCKTRGSHSIAKYFPA